MKPNVRPLKKPTYAKRNRETILPSRLALIINDIIAVVLFAISIMMSIAFFTHSLNDNCWSRSFDSRAISNKLGALGAYLSDVLFYILGFSAWWLVLGIFYLGFQKINRHKIPIGGWLNITRIISYVVLITASASFEYIILYHQPSQLPDGFGGSFGSFVFNNSYHAIGEVGVSLVSLVIILICFSFTFRIPWLMIAEKIGSALEWVYFGLTRAVERREVTQPEMVIDEPKLQVMQSANQEPIIEIIDEVADNSYSEIEEEPVIKKKSFFGDSLFKSKKSQEEDSSQEIDSLQLNLNEAEDEHSENFAQENIKQNGLVDLSGIDDSPSNLDNKEILEMPQDDILDFNEYYMKNVAPVKAELVEANPRLNSLANSAAQIRGSIAKNTLPDTSLLNEPKIQAQGVTPEAIEFVSGQIHNTLAEFGIDVSISNVESGPVITRYELVPPKGVRGDKITSYAKDIARSLALTNIRILENIPGKSSMGIEVPNTKRQVIYLKEIFDSEVYRNNSSLLTLALGKDIAGQTIVMDLAKMPHLLVAGTTGSGKSVAVNAMILSILFNATPEEVKFIMIDPKMVELSFYQDIPHLLAPVVTDMSQAANALKWTVGEMEQRYKIMAKMGTKNIVGFNQKVEAAKEAGKPLFNPYSFDPSDPEPLDKWPYIVVIIDELADLMMVAGKKIEQYIARIAQKARAVGIHLIVATQRPSVDVITGLIKANIPARISFQVSSKIDSRTILDQMGAETLLGQGDMLFLNPGSGFPRRIHGAFVNDDELSKVVDFLKAQGAPNYNEEILTGASDVAIPGFEDETNSDTNSIEKDTVFDQAVKFIQDSKRCSISSLQTQFGIGYNKAARIMNHLEKIGMVRRNERGGFELLNHN